ncbi:MAG: hypothetical protein ACRDPK_06085 [Carbonactinosporaceae bacterium]
MPRHRAAALTAGLLLTTALTTALTACGSTGGGQAQRAMSTPSGQSGSGQDGSGQDGSGQLPQGSEPTHLDPADFTTRIDNPYWPMAPGSRWVYRESDLAGGVQRVEVTVTDKTRKIANGVEARVVHDVVTEDGQLVEDTYDWYAQDRQGNIWYLGEDTKEYEKGKNGKNSKVVSTAGSWEAGVDGAQPGLIMPADPEVGMSYRQEYYAGEAEDAGKILSTDEQAQVPFGHFRDVLLTKDYTAIEPKVLEYKLYAKGVGPVLVLGVSGGSGHEELLRFD